MNRSQDTGVFDKADFMDRVEGDMDLAMELAELFLDDAVEKMAAIRQGIDQGDGQAINKAAHSLKGASANLSAIRLRELAAELEQAGKGSDMSKAAELYKGIEAAMLHFEAALKDQILRSPD